MKGVNQLKRPSDIIIDDFTDINLRTVVHVPIIVVCKNTSDYPGKYTARLWDIHKKPTRFVLVKEKIEEIRRCIPPHMARFEPESIDDPVIVETWI